MTVKSRVTSLVLVGVAAAIAATASAQLVPAGGPGTGNALIVHATYPLGGGAAAATFNPVDGQLLSPGGGYPLLGAVNPGGRALAVGLTPNVPVALSTTPGQVPGIVNAFTRLVGLGGAGRAGLIATNYTMNDNSPAGTAAANTFGGTVDYINTGPAFVVRGGHWISARANPGLGDFSAVGVRSVIEVGMGVGPGFNPIFGSFVPTPIVMGFDGSGPRPDFIQGDFFVFNTAGQVLNFSALSLLNIPIPAGATVRARGTVTLIADPSVIEFTDLDPQILGDLGNGDFVGSAASADAETIITGDDVLHDNGPLSTGSVSQSNGSGGAGVAAPTGTMWSECPDDGAFANTNAGIGNQLVGNNRIADDFTVPPGETWEVTDFDFYAYQTGGNPTTSSFTSMNLQIWDGPPGAGGTVIFGDTATNRLSTSTFDGVYRTFNTRIGGAAPSDGTAPGTTRPVYRNRAAAAVTLSPGTYWVDWQVGGTLASGPWCPPVSVLGQRTAPGNNAVQSVTGSPVYNPVVDAADPAAGEDVALDMPFRVIGTISTGPGCDPDFNCDGNADQDDVACLIDVVAGNPGCECQDPDFNQDGNVDQDDVAAMINVVAGGPCP